MQIETSDLKSCPFCGAEAVLETFTTALEKKPRFCVRCSNRECRISIDWDWWSEDEAKSAWNRRANDGTV